MVRLSMEGTDETLTPGEVAARRKLRLEAQHLQLIEGNPLDADDVAMFEMFDRECWSDERCRAYILERIRREQQAAAAE